MRFKNGKLLIDEKVRKMAFLIWQSGQGSFKAMVNYGIYVITPPKEYLCATQTKK
jgi:hypothetical protein